MRTSQLTVIDIFEDHIENTFNPDTLEEEFLRFEEDVINELNFLRCKYVNGEVD
jgi:hypothetical protein